MTQQWLFLPVQACQALSLEMPVRLLTGDVLDTLTLEQAMSQLRAPWQLVLPVEAVTACAVQLPTRKARWLRQALPFAVEELLAEEVEQMHLALGAALADGRQRVYAVRAAWLRELLGYFTNCPAAAIGVDADMLPSRGTSLLYMQQRWLVGGECAARLAIDGASWPQLAGQFAPEPIAYAQAASEVLPGAVQVELTECPEHWLVAQETGVDLAQGEFAQNQQAGRHRRWLSVAVAAALCVALQWGFNLLEGRYLQQQADDYARASEQLYRELFPQDSKLIDLRAQLDQHLMQQAPSGSAWQGLLSPVAQVLTDGAVRIEQLDYSAVRADVALQLWAPDFAALEQMRQRLEDTGRVVQMGSASREAEGVSARMVIGG